MFLLHRLISPVRHTDMTKEYNGRLKVSGKYLSLDPHRAIEGRAMHPEQLGYVCHRFPSFTHYFCRVPDLHRRQAGRPPQVTAAPFCSLHAGTGTFRRSKSARTPPARPCSDSPEPAQVMPLMHMPQRVFSYSAPDGVAVRCGTVTFQKPWRRRSCDRLKDASP